MTEQSIDSIKLRLTQLAGNNELFIESINTAKDEYLLEIFPAVVELFNNDEHAALSWLLEPCYSLGKQLPIGLANSANNTENLLAFIDGLNYGVFA